MIADMLRTSYLFAREWTVAPWTVGAIWPSSGQLAKRIAREVPAGEGLIVELGGGTGAVTQALLDHGVAAERLVVVERSARFVRHLRNRFPDICVMHADAACLADCLPAGVGVDAIVSCLPLRSLPQRKAEAIVAQWRRILAGAGVVIQFTYDIRASRRFGKTSADPGFEIASSRIVWANLPPARVMTLSARRA